MPTFTQIGSAVVVGGTSQAAIDFTSIPATYTDLVMKLSLRQDTTNFGSGITMTFNNNTSSSYSMRLLRGNPSSNNASSALETTLTSTFVGVTQMNTASTFTNMEMYIPNYASTTTAKSVSIDEVTEANQIESRLYLIANLWNPSSQAAIDQITLTATSFNFVQYSTAYLYGVSNA
jgi:hypothetical protein